MKTCTCGHAHSEQEPGQFAPTCGDDDCSCTTFTEQLAEAPSKKTALELVTEFVAAGELNIDDVRSLFADGADILDPDADGDTDPMYEPFEMPIMVIEGIETGDGRFIDKGILTWRDLPLPTMGILKTTFGHQEAELVGRLDTIERVDISKEINSKTGQPYGDGVTALMAKGVFNQRTQADEIADLVRDQFLRGVSVDIGDVESVFELVDEDGNIVEEENPFLDFLFWSAEGDSSADNEDDDEVKYHFRERITAGRVMGVTVCPFPAFEGAYIRLTDGTETPRDAVTASAGERFVGLRILDDPFERDCEPCKAGGAITASTGTAPMYPPKSWFEMEEPDELTPMTITDDGRIFGHAAGWQTCHIGVQGRCLLASRSQTDYASFMKGAIKTADGDLVRVGVLTMGTGHANTDPSQGPIDAQAALSHYDNTGTVAAHVTAKDGKHGIWVCGTIEPDLSELQIRKLRGAAMSGDWRPYGYGVEMIAILAVNTPGFVVPRAQVASGRVQALVAAGVVQGKVATDRRSDPAFTQFMEYVLEKDAQALRSSLHQRHNEVQDRVSSQIEREAARLRSRVHPS